MKRLTLESRVVFFPLVVGCVDADDVQFVYRSQVGFYVSLTHVGCRLKCYFHIFRATLGDLHAVFTDGHPHVGEEFVVSRYSRLY